MLFKQGEIEMDPKNSYQKIGRMMLGVFSIAFMGFIVSGIFLGVTIIVDPGVDLKEHFRIFVGVIIFFLVLVAFLAVKASVSVDSLHRTYRIQSLLLTKLHPGKVQKLFFSLYDLQRSKSNKHVVPTLEEAGRTDLIEQYRDFLKQKYSDLCHSLSVLPMNNVIQRLQEITDEMEFIKDLDIWGSAEDVLGVSPKATVTQGSVFPDAVPV